jgi:hypothetical protein
MTKDLSNALAVQAHYCLITKVVINCNIFYTIGEDFIINKFELLENRKVNLIQSQNIPKLINLAFVVNGKMFITEYGASVLKEM